MRTTMEINISVSGKMAKKTERGFIYGPMEKNM